MTKLLKLKWNKFQKNEWNKLAKQIFSLILKKINVKLSSSGGGHNEYVR